MELTQDILLKIEDNNCIIGFDSIEKRAIENPNLIYDLIKYLQFNFDVDKTIIDLRDTKAIYNDIDELLSQLYYDEFSILACENTEIIKELKKYYGDVVIPTNPSTRITPIPYCITSNITIANDQDMLDKSYKGLSDSNRLNINKEIESKYLHDSLSSFINIVDINGRFKVIPCHGMALFDIKIDRKPSLYRPMRYSESKKFDDNLIIKFEKLINEKNIKERYIQEFIEEHPQLMKGLFPDGARLYPHLSLYRDEQGPLIPDFFVQPFSEKYLEVVDLKLPSKNIVINKRNRNHFSSDVIEGISQLREYASYFDDERNRSKFISTLCSSTKEIGLSCYKPMSTLVIGNDESWKDNLSILRDKRTSYQDINIVTYDELIRKCRNRLLI